MHAPALLRYLCLISLAAGLAAVDGGGTTLVATGNLLENPSFELGTGGTSHGDFTTPGWVGHYNAYTWAGINRACPTSALPGWMPGIGRSDPIS